MISQVDDNVGDCYQHHGRHQGPWYISRVGRKYILNIVMSSLKSNILFLR